MSKAALSCPSLNIVEVVALSSFSVPVYNNGPSIVVVEPEKEFRTRHDGSTSSGLDT